jgi:2-polyprenyl-3-methyl-5-hydroxy-6-metoxy-1,4-benzoquinol methylase
MISFYCRNNIVLKTMNNTQIGSSIWNDEMFKKHPTPYTGIAGFIEKKRIQKIVGLISKKIKNNKKTLIFEVGCEAGNLLNALANKFPDGQFVGTDISETALGAAKNRLSDKVKLINLDITSDFDIKNSQEIDFLICSEVLEHVSDIDKAIRGLYKLAGPETTIIITVPIEGLKNFIKKVLQLTGIFKLFFKGIEDTKSEWHIQNFSKKSIFKYLYQYFKIERHSTYFFLHRFIIARK